MAERARKKTHKDGKKAVLRRGRLKHGITCSYDSIMSTDEIDRYGGLPYDLRVWANRLFHAPQDDCLYGGHADDELK